MKRKYWIIAGVVIILVIAFRIYRNKTKVTFTVAYTVGQQDVKQTVIATGTVTSQSDLNLSFKNGGALTKLNVNVGDKVRQGQVLAMLDEKDAAASITQAKGQLLAAQANYQKILNGASSVDIQVAQTAVETAQVALRNAQTAYNNTVSQQNVSVGNALATMLNSGLAAEPSPSNSSTATVAISGTYTSAAQGSYTLTALSTGAGTQYSITGLEQGFSGTISRGLTQAMGTRGLFFNFSTTGTLNNGDSWTINIPNTKASTYLTNYNAYQSALQAQTSAVSTAQGAVDTAQAQLDNAKAQLALKQSAARPEDVQAGQAQVQQAQAALDNANNTYENNMIVAPIDGTITAVDAKIGETIAPQKEVIVLLDQGSLHVESNISESSIALVKNGQSIDMTLDAFGPDRHFSGDVLSIDPAATVSQGVINYRVVSSLPSDPGIGIKPGMTVNVSIQISDKPNVLAVPNRLIKSSGDKKYVTVVRGRKTVDVDIQTGAVGDNFTEVTGGLNQGDQIANPAS